MAKKEPEHKLVVPLPRNDDEDVLVMGYDLQGLFLQLEIPYADLEFCGFRRVGKYKWKTLPEAAEITGMSVDALRRLCVKGDERGILTHRRKNRGGRGKKGEIAIHKDVLKELIESQTVHGTKKTDKVFPSIRPRRKPLKYLTRNNP